MNNNDYQIHTEPSMQEIWYSNFLNSISQQTTEGTLNRYKNKIYLTSYTGVHTIEFIKRSQLYLKEDPTDTYYFVDASKRYRPDLISLEMYGTPILYWVILECNNLFTPLDVETNLTLRIPSLSRILRDGRLV